MSYTVITKTWKCRGCHGTFITENEDQVICLICDSDDYELLDVDETEYDDDILCVHCGAHYDGGSRCGTCGNGDPLDTGEFDPISGEPW
ncbi:MAG: hypothetical protein HQK77_14230 [Desulfobacterales bacterium]|nr:hypothetical protein [Desulfobacterales bacterium]